MHAACRAAASVLLLLVLPSLGLAQRTIEGTKQARNHTVKNSGFFGHVYGGLTYGFLSPLTTDLNKDGGLKAPAFDGYPGEDFEARGLGNDLGAQVGMLFRQKWIVQGGISYREYTASRTALRGEAWLRTTTFGGHVGYAIRNRDQLLLYPFVGYYAGTANLRIENDDVDPVQFGSREIAEASNVNFTATTGTVELGLGTQYLLGRQVDRGFYLGAQVGGYFGVGGDNWQAGSSRVSDTETPAFSGAYLRVTLGFGSFNVSREGVEGRTGRRRGNIYEDQPDPALDDLFQQPGGNTRDNEVKRDTRNTRDVDRDRQDRSRSKSRTRKQQKRDKRQPLDYDDVDNR